MTEHYTVKIFVTKERESNTDMSSQHIRIDYTQEILYINIIYLYIYINIYK